jgi:hypothetical protein
LLRARVRELESQLADREIKVNCAVCHSQPKEVVLYWCGHMLCNHCCTEQVERRKQYCPVCGEAVGNDEIRELRQ